MRSILALAWAEVLHVVRDRATLFQVLFIPLVQLVVLANAATFEIRDTPTMVVDLDGSSASRTLVSHFRASTHFRIVGETRDAAAADRALMDGRATLVLAIPADFERSLVRERSADVQLLLDAEKGLAAGIVQSYATRIISATAAELGAVAGRDGPRRGIPAVDVRARGWYNAELNYQHYMVPGILVALVTLIGTLMTAQNIARERELGTLEQLNVTPITRGQFIAGKMLPFWVIGLIELAMGLAIARLVFDVPVRGSLLLLFAVASVYLVVALAIGLWISTAVDTQQQAMFVTFFILVIYLLMSGLYTPVDSMPHWVRLAAELNPVKHFVLIGRAVLVKGAGLADVARPALILVAYAATILFVAVRRYSKRGA